MPLPAKWSPKTTSPVLTKNIPSFPFADPKKRHIVSYDEYLKSGGYQALRKALSMTPESVVEEVKKSQLRGRGGAGFPCGLKWSFLPKPDPKSGDGGPRYLAINADESEPGTFKDRLLCDFDPHLVLEGIAICCYACRIQTAYFYIRGEYHHQAHVMESAIQEAYAHGIFGGGTGLLTSEGGTGLLTSEGGTGLLTSEGGTGLLTSEGGTGLLTSEGGTGLLTSEGGTGLLTSEGGTGLLTSGPGSGLLSGTPTANPFSNTKSGIGWAVDCYLHRGAGAYICGEETGLLESLEGKRGWPRNKPPFPAIKGLFQRPTIINNVETLAHLPFIISEGADAFAKQGTESSFKGAPPSYGTKLMGVSGHVNKPGVFECDLGIPLRILIDDYCGGMRGGKKFKGAIPGGISMGILGPDQFDAELDFDIGRKYNVLGLGTACPTVFDEDTDMVAVARNIARFFKHESCGQCTPCREGSGWLYQLMCRIEDGDAKTKDLDLALEIATSMGVMTGTTICGLADGNNWAIRTIMNKYRDEFEARVKPSFVPVKMTIGAAAKD